MVTVYASFRGAFVRWISLLGLVGARDLNPRGDAAAVGVTVAFVGEPTGLRVLLANGDLLSCGLFTINA